MALSVGWTCCFGDGACEWPGGHRAVLGLSLCSWAPVMLGHWGAVMVRFGSGHCWEAGQGSHLELCSHKDPEGAALLGWPEALLGILPLPAGPQEGCGPLLALQLPPRIDHFLLGLAKLSVPCWWPLTGPGTAV